MRQLSDGFVWPCTWLWVFFPSVYKWKEFTPNLDFWWPQSNDMIWNHRAHFLHEDPGLSGEGMGLWWTCPAGFPGPHHLPESPWCYGLASLVILRGDAVLGIEPRAFTWLHPSPLGCFLLGYGLAKAPSCPGCPQTFCLPTSPFQMVGFRCAPAGLFVVTFFFFFYNHACK